MKSNQSLQRRLLTPLLIFLPLIMATTGWMEYRTSAIEVGNMMDSKGQALVTFLQNVSPTYLTNYDLSALDRFVDNSKADPEVSFAVFFDDKGKVLTQNSKLPESENGLLVFTRDINNSNGAKIGSVKVGYRQDAIHAVLQHTFFTVMGGMLFAVAMIFVVVLGTSRKVVSLVGDAVKQLSRSGVELGAAARGFVGASQKLSTSSHEQDQSVTRSVAALNELTSMIEKTAINARKSSEIAGLSQEGAVRGKEVVDGLLEAISAINRSNTELNEQIKRNNEQLREVNAIIGTVRDRTLVVNDIVFQTKLLSFNASVEAARAGEHGRGFAVVAEEVGKLAAMSGAAAKEIGELLATSVDKVNGINKESERRVNALLETTHRRHEEGAAMAHRCHEAFNDIATKVRSAFEMANEIATANAQQSNGVQDIQLAMHELKRQMEHNREISEMQNGMAAQLNAEAGTLHEVMNELTVLVNGAVARDAHVVAFEAPPAGEKSPGEKAA
jgi:methyl-accepting chemotaxis protein